LSLVSIVNVSYYKKSESILTEFVEKYYLLLKTVKEGIIIVDIESGLILEANDRAVDIFEVSMSNLIGTKHIYFIPEEQRDAYETFFKKKSQIIIMISMI
jgi:two-component system, cell cycle sensor histidine kinase and response regulator CckA